MIVDTINKFGVGIRNDRVVILAFGRELTQDNAYNLAAWLVVNAEALEVMQGADYDETSDFDVWLAATRKNS